MWRWTPGTMQTSVALVITTDATSTAPAGLGSEWLNSALLEDARTVRHGRPWRAASSLSLIAAHQIIAWIVQKDGKTTARPVCIHPAPPMSMDPSGFVGTVRRRHSASLSPLVHPWTLKSILISHASVPDVQKGSPDYHSCLDHVSAVSLCRVWRPGTARTPPLVQ